MTTTLLVLQQPCRRVVARHEQPRDHDLRVHAADVLVRVVAVVSRATPRQTPFKNIDNLN